MAGPEFHQTGYGRTFFEYQLPTLIKALTRLAEALEKQNAINCKQEEGENDKDV